MDFRILGPIEVADGERLLELGRPKQRALLALLLLRPGQPVSADRLIDELWRERPPVRAAASLQSYVSNLRRVLEPRRPGGAPPRLLVRQPGGYVLRVEAGDVDSCRFESGVADARQAVQRGEPSRAAPLYAAALAEWRGEPLADLVDELPPLPELTRLGERRLSAVEESFACALELGRHDEVVAELEALVRQHPLRERLRGQLALALYRVGRQADALERLREGRGLLAELLGLEPGPELRALEQRILRQDPEAHWSAPPEAVGRPAAASTAGTLVGRDAELAALVDAWKAAARGIGGVVLVSGEPGIGKTRLSEELATHVAASGGVARWARSFEGGGAPALWPWLRVLEEIAADFDDEALRIAAGPEAPDLGRLVPAVADRLGLEPVSLPDAAEARFRLHEAVTRFLLRAAALQPLLLVFDDMHWADDPSLELLGHLGAHVESGSLLVVGTHRDGETERGPALVETLARLVRSAPLVRLPLTGLSREDIARLVAHHLDAPPTESVARFLHERTDGNAFYVSELVRLAQSATGPPAWDAMPLGVREVIERRLLSLSDRVVAALETAAVIGRDFDVATAAAAHRADVPEVLALLDEAVAAQILVDQGEPAFAYRFTHALVRETLYKRLAPSRRARLHARVGDALTALASEARVSEIAFHYEQAAALGYAERAVDAAVAASLQAERLLAYEQAAEHLRQALRVLERFGDPEGRELGVQARLTSLLLETEGYTAPGLAVAAARVLELAPAAGAVPEVAGMLWAISSYRCVRADFGGAVDAADELARATSASREVAEAASLHARGVAYWHLGRLEESAALLEEAIGRLDAADPEALARAGLAHLPLHARCQTAHPYVLVGRREDAEGHVRTALARSDWERQPYDHASAVMFTGWLAALDDEFASALECFDDAVGICEARGFRQLAAIASVPRGWSRARNGDRSGIRAIEAGMAAMDLTGARMLRHWHYGVLADALLAFGCADEALAALEAGLRSSTETGETFHVAELLRLRGEILLARGSRVEGRAALEAALATAERQGAVLLFRRAEAALAAA